MDYLREIKSIGDIPAVVIAPIGFISDHMEVLYDLDTEAAQLCEELKLPMVRAGTVGAHPRFVTMIRELIVERMIEQPVRIALGQFGPSRDICAGRLLPGAAAIGCGRAVLTTSKRRRADQRRFRIRRLPAIELCRESLRSHVVTDAGIDHHVVETARGPISIEVMLDEGHALAVDVVD